MCNNKAYAMHNTAMLLSAEFVKQHLFQVYIYGEAPLVRGTNEKNKMTPEDTISRCYKLIRHNL